MSASLSNAIGRWRAAEIGSREEVQRSSATAIVSSTVRDGNRRASWNDRPSPLRARSLAVAEERSWPPSSTLPASVGVVPPIRSNSVVFPATFGPMKPTI